MRTIYHRFVLLLSCMIAWLSIVGVSMQALQLYTDLWQEVLIAAGVGLYTVSATNALYWAAFNKNPLFKK